MGDVREGKVLARLLSMPTKATTETLMKSHIRGLEVDDLQGLFYLKPFCDFMRLGLLLFVSGKPRSGSPVLESVYHLSCFNKIVKQSTPV